MGRQKSRLLVNCSPAMSSAVVLKLQDRCREFPCVLLVDQQPGVIVRVPKDAVAMFGDPALQHVMSQNMTAAQRFGKEVCDYCGKIDVVRLMVCSKCRKVRYCSTLCQKSDWREHKAVCSTFATMSREQVQHNHLARRRDAKKAIDKDPREFAADHVDEILLQFPEWTVLRKEQIVELFMQQTSCASK